MKNSEKALIERAESLGTLEYQGQSNCCDKPVYGPESDICSKCGEHCEVILLEEPE